MRWKGIIPLFVISAILFFVSIFLLDDIIQKGIEKAGSSVWGASVEVDDVMITWSPPGIILNGLAIASRDKEYKNLLEVASIDVSIELLPLLEKKLAIRRAAGTGLGFNTERETSGFLPDKKRDKREEVEGRWKENMSDWIKDVQKRGREKIDVKKSFNKDELSSLKVVKSAEEKISGLEKKYGNIRKINAEATVKNLTDSIGKLSAIKIETAQDVQNAMNIINKANTSIDEARDTGKVLHDSIRDLQSSVSDIAATVKAAEAARKEDMSDLMKKLKLPSIETEDIAETVFGPLLTEKFTMIAGYMGKVRKYMPPKKEKEEVVKKPRKRGEDILFVREGMKPSWHLIEAELSGESAKAELADISAQPWLVERPASAVIEKGDFSSRLRVFRNTEEPYETLELDHKSFKISGATGTLNMSAVFTDKIDAKISWSGRGLLPDTWLEYLSLEDPLIEVNAVLTGDILSPALRIDSNLDEIISDQLKKELARKIEQAKKEINGLLDENVNKRIQEIRARLDAFKKDKLTKLDEEKKQLEGKKQELGKEVEKKKKEAEDKLAQEAEKKLEKGVDKLKDLFK